MKAELVAAAGILILVGLAATAGTAIVLGLLNLAGPRFVYAVVRHCAILGLGAYTALVLPAYLVIDGGWPRK